MSTQGHIAWVWASVVALALAPGVALAQIDQPGTQPIGETGGIVTLIQASQTCKTCHGTYDDTDDYEPWDSWRGTMMGNAGRDPIFRAALAIAEQDNPDAPDFCVRCHSMPAWLRGRSSLPEWTAADGPRFEPDDDLFPSTDQDGVACMVCHRATDEVPSDPMAPYRGNAQIFFFDSPDGDLRTGPYMYAPGTEPPHPTRQDDFIASSQLCAQCHDISNPVVAGLRADGTPTGRDAVIERTFSEWEASAFATRGESCQSCHMPEMEEDVPAANGGVLRDYMRRHRLVGSSSWVLRALAATVPDASGDWTAALMSNADNAEDFLRTAARVTIESGLLEGENARATVRVENLTGHKLPTGYPEGRRMWLEVAIVDSTGAVTGGSGLYDDATSTLLTDAQIRTYEVHLGIGTTPSFHFIQNDTVLEDTRIPPEGFAPPEDRDMAPIGRDYSDGSGGYRNFDEASYTIAACGEGTLTLRARLRFQSTTREYVEFLRDTAPDSLDPEVDGSWGEIAYALWEEHGGGVPTEMAEVTMDLGPSPAPCPEPMPDGGMASDAATGGDAGPRVDGGGGGDDDGGCGCAVPGGTRVPAPFALFAASVLGWVGRRRWRRPERR